jgi:ribose/xylose/arabinose/galactoside ABC-type transport system permease subunit
MRQFRTELGLIAAIIVVFGAAFLRNPVPYLEEPGYNARLLLHETSLLGIFALGAAVVIISGGIDLSSGAVIAFSGSVCACVISLLTPQDARGYPDFSQLTTTIILAGMFASLLAGLCIGTLHTWLITVVRLPPFVATLASLVGLRSLGQLMNKAVNADGSINIVISNSLFKIAGSQWWIALSIFLILSLLIWFLLTKTVAGRHLYAMGGNERAAHLSGIRTDRLKWLAYSISAVTASLAGLLYTSQVGASDPILQGRGYELNAIAAAVIGGCSLQGGYGTVTGVMLGVLFLRVVVDSVAKVFRSNATDYEGLVVGFLVVLAVAFNELRQSIGHGGKKFFPGFLGAFSIVVLVLLIGLVGLVMFGTTIGAAAAGITAVVLGTVKTIELRR